MATKRKSTGPPKMRKLGPSDHQLKQGLTKHRRAEKKWAAKVRKFRHR